MITVLNYGETKKSFKNWVFVPFFYSWIYSRIFSSLNHKIRESMPPNKGEFTKPFRYYIYCHTRFVWLASKCSKTCSTNGNMVTRLYSKININCKKLYKKQRYAPIRLFSDSSYRSNDRCELTQDNTNLFIFIGFGEFI